MDVKVAEQLPDDLAQPLEDASARLDPFAGRVQYYEEVSSTNDVVARLASEGAEDGTTVIAGTQTAGRGRRGRTWFSPPGAGLYASVLFRLPGGGAAAPHEVNAPLLTLAAGLAVCEALRALYGAPVEIKWPNDVITEQDPAGGSGSEPPPASPPAPAGSERQNSAVKRITRRKVAGILAESFSTGDVLQYVVLGVGINLKPVQCPPELAGSVTALETILGETVNRGAVLGEVLSRLARRRADLLAGRTAAILKRWRALAPSSAGCRIQWGPSSDLRQGVTAGIDEEGALLVQTGGRLERILSGEITWL